MIKKKSPTVMYYCTIFVFSIWSERIFVATSAIFKQAMTLM